MNLLNILFHFSLLKTRNSSKLMTPSPFLSTSFIIISVSLALIFSPILDIIWFSSSWFITLSPLTSETLNSSLAKVNYQTKLKVDTNDLPNLSSLLPGSSRILLRTEPNSLQKDEYNKNDLGFIPYICRHFICLILWRQQLCQLLIAPQKRIYILAKKD